MFSTIKMGLLAITVGALSCVPAHAQYQNSINGEAARIQQDAASGLINQGQARQLEMRDAQIQNQEQQYLMQNGGRLTSQESHQIRSELKNVNHSLGNDVRRDSGFGAFQSGYPGMQGAYSGVGVQNGYAGMQNGYAGMQNGYTGMPNGFTGMQAGYPGAQAAAYQNGYSNGYGGMQHHHHGILQNGMNQQYGMNSQYVGNQQYGMNPQSGMNSQYGMNSLYGMTGQQGGVGGLLRMFNH